MRVPFQQFERRPDQIDWSDITTSVCTGPAMPSVVGEYIDIPFEPEVTDPEQQRRILIRLRAVDATQEDQVVRARQALTELKRLRDGTSTLTAEQRWRLVGRVLVVLVIRAFRLQDAE